METKQAHIDSDSSYIQVYTDATKNLFNKVGVAIIIPEFHIKIGKKISEVLGIQEKLLQ